jgi:hypothetical protein
MVKRNFILLVLIGVFITFGNAFAHDYFPESVGSTWSYQVGDEIVNATIASPGNWLVEEDANYFTRVGNALYFTGVAWPDGGRNYDPYLLSLPASPGIGIYQQEQIIVSYYEDSLNWEETWDVRVEIVAIEDVSVPKGDFANCLKVNEYILVKDSLDPAQIGRIRNTDIWYAEGVGIVKFIDDGAEFQLTDYKIVSEPDSKPSTMPWVPLLLLNE